MGKKKSVALMVLLTIVIIALCAITAFPVFSVPGTVKKWNPAVLQYDFGADLGGGYYAYYYPKGVKSETEFSNLSEEEQKGYTLHKEGLYLSNDVADNILDADGKVTEEFETAFEAATKEITARFAKKQYSDYRVSVVNGYALRVEVPAYEKSQNQEDSFSYASQAIRLFSMTGELSIAEGTTTSDTVVEELKNHTIKELIKEIYLDVEQEVVILRVKFTELGKEVVEDYKATAASDTSTYLNLKIGEDTILNVNSSYITENNNIYYPLVNESEIRHAETLEIILNSALNGGFDIEFTEVTDSEIRTFEYVYGDNTVTYLYIMILVAIVLTAVVSIVKMGRYGVLNVYMMLSYIIVTGLCFAFISQGVFEVTLGTVVVFLAGLALINVLNAHIYHAIKNEFDLGKTVESSVKAGFKKTIFGIVDIYAVLLLGGIALSIGVAGLHTFAAQALICIIMGAFVNLLWTRAINYVFLSASKNKLKYFRFVREEDNDDE